MARGSFSAEKPRFTVRRFSCPTNQKNLHPDLERHPAVWRVPICGVYLLCCGTSHRVHYTVVSQFILRLHWNVYYFRDNVYPGIPILLPGKL